mmetsp:Transcript_11584/g.32909  ORF Transcript_11584/g.32909 Transcript_11584/m.32909 type:complete len:329 (+) Transcript_11584:1992-2978(+)
MVDLINFDHDGLRNVVNAKGEVGMVEPMRNVLLAAGEHIVEDDHFMSLHHQLVDQMTAHEASTARDENLHPLRIGNLGSLHNVGSSRRWDALTGQDLLILQEALLGLRDWFLMRLEAHHGMLIHGGRPVLLLRVLILLVGVHATLHGLPLSDQITGILVVTTIIVLHLGGRLLFAPNSVRFRLLLRFRPTTLVIFILGQGTRSGRLVRRHRTPTTIGGPSPAIILHLRRRIGASTPPPMAGILEPVQGIVQADLVHHQEGQDEVSQGNAAHEGEGGLAGEEAGAMAVPARGAVQLHVLLPEGAVAAGRGRTRGSDQETRHRVSSSCAL